MSRNGATIYWIDPVSASLNSCVIMEYELKGGATYETEALWKMPDNVLHYEIILFSEAGNASSVARLEKLKSRALEF